MYAFRASTMPLLRNITMLGAALSIAFAAACGIDVGQDGDFAAETEACVECQTILVECTSTCVDESEFVGCRDQWQQCQQGRGLTAETCSNPSDQQACDLCRTRLDECTATEGDEPLCQSQFTVCKSFLITREDLSAQCTTEDEVPPEVSCGICQKDVAVCLSDVTLDNALAMCSTKFESCLGAHSLDVATCAMPADSIACGLCTQHHDDCLASGGPSCVEGFTQCATSIAANAACELQGGGDGGAGGGAATGCAHDECSVGLALEATCSDCAEAVCAQDDWCCSNEWDDLCVELAAGVESCGCAS